MAATGNTEDAFSLPYYCYVSLGTSKMSQESFTCIVSGYIKLQDDQNDQMKRDEERVRQKLRINPIMGAVIKYLSRKYLLKRIKV